MSLLTSECCLGITALGVLESCEPVQREQESVVDGLALAPTASSTRAWVGNQARRIHDLGIEHNLVIMYRECVR